MSLVEKFNHVILVDRQHAIAERARGFGKLTAGSHFAVFEEKLLKARHNASWSECDEAAECLTKELEQS